MSRFKTWKRNQSRKRVRANSRKDTTIAERKEQKKVFKQQHFDQCAKKNSTVKAINDFIDEINFKPQLTEEEEEEQDAADILTTKDFPFTNIGVFKNLY